LPWFRNKSDVACGAGPPGGCIHHWLVIPMEGKRE
jgi:hypothetical protein